MAMCPEFSDSPRPGRRLAATAAACLVLLGLFAVVVVRSGQDRGRGEAAPLPCPLPRVLLFGSSVDCTVRSGDPEQRTLPDLLAAELPPSLTLSGLNHAAYYGPVYAAYARHLERRGVRDRLAVMQINLRSLNRAWSDNPDWAFRDLERSLRSWEPSTPPAERLSVSLQVKPVLWMREKLAAVPHRLPSAGGADPVCVTLPDGSRLTRSEYNALLLARPREAQAERRRQRELLGAHAAYRLDPADSAGLRGLREAGMVLRDLGWRVMYYVTPMDVQYARALDPALERAIRRNARAAAGELEAEGFAVANLVGLAPSQEFIDREMVIEHLSGAGKKRLARALAPHVRALAAASPLDQARRPGPTDTPPPGPPAAEVHFADTPAR